MEYQDQYQEVPKPNYECLIFDVDDTLYPFSSGLSAQVTKNISEYMVQKLGVEESKVVELCHELYINYGTTMAGLRAIGYDFDYDDYHSFVHGRLPYELLKPDPVLRTLLHSLPIRKVIFSNGDEAHVAKVLHRLGLEDCFEDVICFETLNPTHKSKDNANEESTPSGTTVDIADGSSEMNGVSVLPKTPVVCKPFEDAFEQAFKIAGVNPHKTQLFFDDSIRNLETGKVMGLHTVMVGCSIKKKGVDYALGSIHNIREALPELWEAVTDKSENIQHSGEAAIETCVRA